MYVSHAATTVTSTRYRPTTVYDIITTTSYRTKTSVTTNTKTTTYTRIITVMSTMIQPTKITLFSTVTTTLVSTRAVPGPEIIRTKSVTVTVTLSCIIGESHTTNSGNTMVMKPTPSSQRLESTTSNQNLMSTNIICIAGLGVLGGLTGIMFLVLVVVIVGWIYTWNAKVKRKRSVGKDSDNAAACR